MTSANGSLLLGFAGGELVRWYPIEDEASAVDMGRQRAEIGRVLQEPKGFHALVSTTGGDSWYLTINSSQARLLPKLKGHIIEAVVWDEHSTDASTGDVLVGTMAGQILHVVI